MKKSIPKKCKNPECSNSAYSILIPYCGHVCKNKMKTPDIKLKSLYKPIAKFSKKRQIENLQYQVLRIEFLSKIENGICFIDNCNKTAYTIEHTMGRKGFADDYARDNNISLYLDIRFWKPCCNAHNLELENNSELSNKYQYSKISGKKKSDL